MHVLVFIKKNEKIKKMKSKQKRKKKERNQYTKEKQEKTEEKKKEWKYIVKNERRWEKGMGEGGEPTEKCKKSQALRL